MTIRAGNRCVSTVWDKSLQLERQSLYIPALPVAAWMVRNWWFLFHETCHWESPPRTANNAAQWQWLQRHCLRTADSSLMLPALSLFHDGNGLRACWHADSPATMPNMPGNFLAEGEDRLDLAATQLALKTFIDAVFDRLTPQSHDDEVEDLRTQWQAIQNADADEMEFCQRAGRLGVDPYNPDEMTEDLASFLEAISDCCSEPLFDDLADVSSGDAIVSQWQWLKTLNQRWELRPIPQSLLGPLPDISESPPQFGYRLADIVRTGHGSHTADSLSSVEILARNALGHELQMVSHHGPWATASRIRAIVGRTEASNSILSVVPPPRRIESFRFLQARSLYHALVTIRTSERLVTDGYTWDQKASRAFAAELLAPRQEILNAIQESVVDMEVIENLAQQFQVSSLVIERQLENAGVAVVTD